MGRKAVLKKRRLNTVVRGRLLDAVKPLLCTGQAAEQKIAAIIDHIGISKSTFYEHFESKDDLIISVTDDLLERIHKCVNILEKQSLPLVERFIRHLVRISEELSGISGCMLENISSQYPALGEKISCTFSEWEKTLCEFIEAGIKQEVFEPFSPKVFSRLVIASFKDACMGDTNVQNGTEKADKAKDLIKINVKALVRQDKISFEKILPLIEKRFSLTQWEHTNNVFLPVNCARTLGLPCPSGICG